MQIRSRARNEQLLATKFFVPPLRAQSVTRTRLTQTLDDAIARGQKCILVVAPAGFGKTTLVTAWLAQLRNRHSDIKNSIAWLSLDDADNDLTRFLTYMLTALEPLVESNASWDTLIQRLSDYPPPPPDAILIPVLNALTPERGNNLQRVLVLDDYHVIQTDAIHRALAFFIEHLPPQWHIVMTTRTDPPLPLSRWRARGELGQIRAEQLTFTEPEAAAFMNETMALHLETTELQALAARTEGWVAGLQLAGIALSGDTPQADRAHFIRAFTGTHRVIADYLLEEVLQRQPHPIQQFLLQTSILERFNAPLCQAVLESTHDQRAVLSELERNHLFVVPLDDAAEWYRYHPLWRDALRFRMQQTASDQIPALHARAGAWLQANGFIADAIDHAFRANDLTRVVALVEQHAPLMLQENDFAPLREWFTRLPDAVYETHPRLCLDRAWWLFQTGARQHVEAMLARAERALEHAAVSPAQTQALRGELETLRSALDLERGDLRAALEHATRAQLLTGDTEIFIRGLPEYYAALAKFWDGQVWGIEAELSHAAQRAVGAGNALVAFTANCTRGEVLLVQGRFAEALQELLALETYLKHLGVERRPFAALLYVNLAMVHYELNDLPACRAACEQTMALSEFGGMPRPREWVIAASFLAWIDFLEGRRDHTLDLLARCREHLKQYELPAWATSQVIDVEICVETWERDLEDTRAMLERSAFVLGDEPTYVNELAQMALIRVQMLHGAYAPALAQILRMTRAAERFERVGSLIRLYALQAVLQERVAQHDAAFETLERALDIGQTHHAVRSIIDEGETIEQLLQEKFAQPDLPHARRAYLERLLVEAERDRLGVGGQIHAAAPHAAAVSQRVGESPPALSERERQILERIAKGQSHNEIAAGLDTGVGALKLQLNSIYQKLDADNRAQALERARALGLLK